MYVIYTRAGRSRVELDRVETDTLALVLARRWSTTISAEVIVCKAGEEEPTARFLGGKVLDDAS